MIIPKSLLINDLERIILPGLLLTLLEDKFGESFKSHIEEVIKFITKRLPEKIRINTTPEELIRHVREISKKTENLNHKLLDFFKSKNANFPILLSLFLYEKSFSS